MTRLTPAIPLASLPASLGRAASAVAGFAKAHSTLLAIALGLLAILALVVIPWVVVSMPEDYFAATGDSAHEQIPILTRIGRNILGWVLMLIGLALFIPPGLGTVFMVAGGVLMDFPYKRALERRAVKLRGVLPILNAIRRLGRVPRFRV